MTASRLDNIVSIHAARNGGSIITKPARKSRPYFLLAVKIDGRWTQQFGDFDRECVDYERDDYADRGEAKRKDMKVVRVGDARKVSCDNAMTVLNVNP